jgi:ureidoglycolate dehydrogenase (NAD+)
LATVRAEALQALASEAFVACGVPGADAQVAARVLVLADLFGVHTHGVGRIESYCERIEGGGINARPAIRVEHVAPAIVRVDGNDALGPLVGMRALNEAMALARQSGVGIALTHRSNHFGAVGPYNFLAAEAGFASVICSNSTTTIAPTGGREARVGNSPIGFGVPHPGGRPIILDMAVSVVARAKIRDALQRGDASPPTWATDANGEPTTDPRQALDGFLQPIGGYKGYGLALFVDLFAGLLSGAAYLTHVQSWQDAPAQPQNLGHFFLLFDVHRLGPASWLEERIDDFCSIVRSTPRADPERAILLPGELEMEQYDRQIRDGIALEDAVLAKLEALAAQSTSSRRG